jgi:LysR family transcriptional regulator, glycine cleavage system transcriptional activator
VRLLLRRNKRVILSGRIRKPNSILTERLPSLNALRAFEAAARHLSFSKAAEELHVTPAAISQQIKSLESYLGAALFHRLNRALKLTRAAETAMPQLREGFDRLADAVRQLRGNAGYEALRVWTAPSFGGKWLVPRLEGFATRHPGIDLDISVNARLIGETPSQEAIGEHFGRREVDVAIPFGKGEYPGYRTHKLFDAQAVPLCSPRLLEDGAHRLRRPEDLRYHTLLHDDTDYEGRPDWNQWLTAARVEDIDATHGPRFNNMSMALDAAVNGQGVVLGLYPLAQYDIEAGRLAVAFDLCLPLEHAYYVVSPEKSADEDNVRAFRNWLLGEARRSAGAPRARRGG